MVLKNYIYNLMYQIIILLLPIITIPYISRTLGAEGIGIYALTNTYAQYFVFVGMLGLSIYSSREVAYVKDDKKSLNNVFWELNGIRIITMSISIIAYSITFFFLVESSYKIIYIIQTLVLFSSLIDISWFFIGLENFKKVVLRNTLVKLIGTSMVFIFVKDINDLWLYSLILAGTQFIGQVIMWFDLPQYIVFKRTNTLNIRRHLGSSIKLFIPQIAISIYTMLDKAMLGAMSSEVQVGLYDNAQKIVKMLSVVVTTLSTVTIPKMANLYKKKKYKEFNENVYKSFSFVSFISFPMTFGLMGISSTFIPWFYGNGFENIKPMLCISTLLIITLGWTSILGEQVLISIQKEKQFTIAVVIGAGVNLILNMLLIKKFEGTGTTIASVIAEYTGMIIMTYFLKKRLSLKELFKDIPKYFLTSIIMLIIIVGIGNFVPSCIMATLLQVFVGAFMYIGVMIILKDRNIIYLWDIISNNFRLQVGLNSKEK